METSLWDARAIRKVVELYRAVTNLKQDGNNMSELAKQPEVIQVGELTQEARVSADGDGVTYHIPVYVYAEEGGLRYNLGRFDYNSPKAAVFAVHSIKFIGANDQLALELLRGAVVEMEKRIELLRMPVASTKVM
jgi:hypothetical protein